MLFPHGGFQAGKIKACIDHNRYSSGTVKWWNERVNLTRVRAPKGFPGIHFSGKVINQWGSTFAVRGLLPNVHHFSLIGIEETGSAGEHICFNASFSKQIDGVLCGTWSGINHVESIPAIYRIFLSPKPLKEADLQSLTRAARIEPHLKSSEIGFSEVQ